MFCPKCGGTVKEEAGFCPKCGTRLREEEIRNSGGAKPPLGMGWRKLCLVGGGMAALLLAILFLVVILTRRGGEINGQELVDAYFKDHTGYNTANQSLYQDCFRYTVNDMTLQLSNKMAFLLESVGVSTDGVDLEQVSSQVGDKISGYFSRSDNQILLVDSVLSHSSCKVGKIRRDGDRARAEVTVTSLDISDVNRLLVDDSVSVQGFASLAVQFVLGNKADFIGNLMDAVSGDLSFVVNGFVEKADEAKGQKTCVGEVEFVYDRESGEWSVSGVDDGLLDAYYGIGE